MKKSIIIYADCIAILEELTYEQIGRLFKAIFSYINEEPVTEISGDPAVKMAFKVLKTQIDRDAERYAEKCEKNRQIAIAREKRRKELREQANTNVHEREQTDTNVTYNDSDSENDSEVTNVTNNTTTVVDNLAPNGALSPKGDAINFGSLVLFFNKTIEKFRSVIRPIKDIKGKRQDAVRARVRERGKNSLAKVIENAAKSDFLNGKNDRGFIATFDWLVSPNNFIKVLEGNYDNRVIKNREDDWLKEYEERQAREEEERQRSKAGAVDHDEFLKLKEEGKI
jgi:hypothetical protein